MVSSFASCNIDIVQKKTLHRVPPGKKQVHNHGLGKAIMNHRAKSKIIQHQKELHTTEVYQNKPISITQENDLENFLNTAALAGTDFTAERQNITILSPLSSGLNPYLLSDVEQANLKVKHRKNKNLLRVPRRPKWSESTTPAQLERLERDGFLEWRKGLADLTDNQSLLLTPFERNLEVWRQLWRVIERSQLIVQIVDARNPLRFRCEDLEKYVEENSEEEIKKLCLKEPPPSNLKAKANLLLLNKSDLLTEKQRALWAEYFDLQGIQYAFFSAADAAALQEIPQINEEVVESFEEEEERNLDDFVKNEVNRGQDASDVTTTEPKEVSPQAFSSPLSSMAALSENQETIKSLLKTKVLTVGELEDLFLRQSQNLLKFNGFSHEEGSEEAGDRKSSKLVVGLVGCPNVGKSSTINALVGSKKVSVSATPGKTKHFQTIHLSPEVVLCDCPGLVFPQFASTKAELMREHTGPISLITRRIPKAVLESTYGLQLNPLPAEEGGDGQVTESEFLTAYAIARGFFTGGGGMGRPDESKAARPILKDYVAAKLLYCEPPPLDNLTAEDFNRETQQIKMNECANKKAAPTNRVPLNSHTHHTGTSLGKELGGGTSSRSRALDERFFKSDDVRRATLPPVKFGVKGRVAQVTNLVEPQSEAGLAKIRLYSKDIYSIDNTGRPISDETRPSSAPQRTATNGKKHFKGNSKKKKMRSGKGYDEL
ncbi:nucleolar GTP-binding protein 2 [Phakopsora pachyrhizi]|uniref:Nucleolar GTP-binding protein 2 n=1 Tax=Phakopsora pachyrhizi TaxID=170000 RepID=A0AAV0AW13_PHAPC|nr:nucleolar GTP-binding protein 2 [Phakopsora pachyrhizi]